MRLRQIYLGQGAELAQDGIPLHFGDLESEYTAALGAAILLDRSHEGRILVSGKDRFELLNRMSTNNILNLKPHAGKPTIFISPNARVIDRSEVFHPGDAALLVMAGPGRGTALSNYLRRNVFFNDQAQIDDVTPKTRQFAIHGPLADQVIAAAFPTAAGINEYESAQVTLDEAQITLGRLKPFEGSHWFLIVDSGKAADLWMHLLDKGQAHGLQPAGGLTFNMLRIRAGIPGVGRELTGEYIPLELGLWDEISFNKGCYTGQEIIARMESRNKLARTIVSLKLDKFVMAPSELTLEGRRIGMLTSSVQAPDGEIFAMGVVKTDIAESGTTLLSPDGTPVEILALLGVQPIIVSD